MNKIVTLNALRGNSYSLFRKFRLMINMGDDAHSVWYRPWFSQRTRMKSQS